MTMNSAAGSPNIATLLRTGTMLVVSFCVIAEGIHLWSIPFRRQKQPRSPMSRFGEISGSCTTLPQDKHRGDQRLSVV